MCRAVEQRRSGPAEQLDNVATYICEYFDRLTFELDPGYQQNGRLLFLLFQHLSSLVPQPNRTVKKGRQDNEMAALDGDWTRNCYQNGLKVGGFHVNKDSQKMYNVCINVIKAHLQIAEKSQNYKSLKMLTFNSNK